MPEAQSTSFPDDAQPDAIAKGIWLAIWWGIKWAIYIQLAIGAVVLLGALIVGIVQAEPAAEPPRCFWVEIEPDRPDLLAACQEMERLMGLLACRMDVYRRLLAAAEIGAITTSEIPAMRAHQERVCDARWGEAP